MSRGPAEAIAARDVGPTGIDKSPSLRDHREVVAVIEDHAVIERRESGRRNARRRLPARPPPRDLRPRRRCRGATALRAIARAERSELARDLARRGPRELGRQRDRRAASRSRRRRVFAVPQAFGFDGEQIAFGGVAIEQQASGRTTARRSEAVVGGRASAAMRCMEDPNRGAEPAQADRIGGGELVADGRSRAIDRLGLCGELIGERDRGSPRFAARPICRRAARRRRSQRRPARSRSRSR